jgi:UDP-glucose 4-epimerase
MDVARVASDEVKRIDVTDFGAVSRRLRGCDAVVHLAATEVGAVPERMCKANVLSTWTVLAACQELGIRKAIIMSSEAALGMEYLDVDPPPLYLPIDEAHPLRPSDGYGVSKQMCEALGRQHARQTPALSVVCLRPTEVLFADVAEQIVAGLEAAASEASGSQTRTTTNLSGLAISRAYVRADDMVRMIGLALEARTNSFETFWASAADTYDQRPTIEVMADLYGRSPKVRRPGFFADCPRASVFETTAARERLGWNPSPGGWDEALASVVD